jgi:hypothetical protein
MSDPFPRLALRPVRLRRPLRRDLAAVAANLRFWWWCRTYPLRWWSPEARAGRAFRRYGGCVYCELVFAGVRDEAAIEDLIQQAFLALHLEYVAGRSIEDVRKFAIDFARAATPDDRQN